MLAPVDVRNVLSDIDSSALAICLRLHDESVGFPSVLPVPVSEFIVVTRQHEGSRKEVEFFRKQLCHFGKVSPKVVLPGNG